MKKVDDKKNSIIRSKSINETFFDNDIRYIKIYLNILNSEKPGLIKRIKDKIKISKLNDNSIANTKEKLLNDLKKDNIQKILDNMSIDAIYKYKYDLLDIINEDKVLKEKYETIINDKSNDYIKCKSKLEEIFGEINSNDLTVIQDIKNTIEDAIKEREELKKVKSLIIRDIFSNKRSSINFSYLTRDKKNYLVSKMKSKDIDIFIFEIVNSLAQLTNDNFYHLVDNMGDKDAFLYFDRLMIRSMAIIKAKDESKKVEIINKIYEKCINYLTNKYFFETDDVNKSSIKENIDDFNKMIFNIERLSLNITEDKIENMNMIKYKLLLKYNSNLENNKDIFDSIINKIEAINNDLTESEKKALYVEIENIERKEVLILQNTVDIIKKYNSLLENDSKNNIIFNLKDELYSFKNQIELNQYYILKIVKLIKEKNIDINNKLSILSNLYIKTYDGLKKILIDY